MTGIPLYLDRAGARRYLGLTRVDADRLFRAVPTFKPGGSRKVYVRHEDAVEWVERGAQKGEVAA